MFTITENNVSGVARGLPGIQVTELCFEGSILCTNSIPKINYEKGKNNAERAMYPILQRKYTT
jgi:hypothetical protein